MQIRTAFRTLLAATAFAALATTAVAAPTITVLDIGVGLGIDEFMIDDFDNAIADGFTFVNDAAAYVRPGALGLDSGLSAPPPGDVSNYETVLGGGHATLTSLKGLQSLSLFMGSPDTYNTIKFSGAGGFSWTLDGAQIFNNLAPSNGDQSYGRRVSYDFGEHSVNKVEFFSTSNSFEFDTIAGRLSGGAVPEPATWATMILGFGVVGATFRRRRNLLAHA
jgi:hypothetical protein